MINQSMQRFADLLDGKLSTPEATALILEISQQPITAALLVALAQILRDRMITIDLGVPVLDTCGTGGDGQHTFNISTAAALVCADLGVDVAKHGNVAATSVSGSADVLQQLGIPIHLTRQAAKEYFQRHHFIFLFAKLYHPAMKLVAPIRQQLGVRTIFNYLGPLCNPAKAEFQLVGVPNVEIAQPIGEALMTLGSQHVVTVHSQDGLDEVSIATPTQVFDFTPRQQRQFTITPTQPYALADIQVSSIQQSADYIQHKPTAAVREAIAMNAGLALYAANQTSNYQTGYQQVYDFLNR